MTQLETHLTEQHCRNRDTEKALHHVAACVGLPYRILLAVDSNGVLPSKPFANIPSVKKQNTVRHRIMSSFSSLCKKCMELQLSRHRISQVSDFGGLGGALAGTRTFPAAAHIIFALSF